MRERSTQEHQTTLYTSSCFDETSGRLTEQMTVRQVMRKRMSFAMKRLSSANTWKTHEWHKQWATITRLSPTATGMTFPLQVHTASRLEHKLLIDDTSIFSFFCGPLCSIKKKCWTSMVCKFHYCGTGQGILIFIWLMEKAIWVEPACWFICTQYIHECRHWLWWLPFAIHFEMKKAYGTQTNRYAGRCNRKNRFMKNYL